MVAGKAYTERWTASGASRAPSGIHEGEVLDAQLHPSQGLLLLVQVRANVVAHIQLRQKERARVAIERLHVGTPDFGGRLPGLIGKRIRACCEHREFVESSRDASRTPRTVRYCYWTDFERTDI